MQLAELCEGAAVGVIEGDRSAEIADLAYDSRRVAPGTLFFCVVGATSDGHEFASSAVASGATALVVERRLGLGVPELRVDDARAAMAPLAAHFFGDPTAGLALAAVTGTNGKTTTAFLVRSILERCGRSCGLLGTIKQVVGGVETDAVRTTPEAIDLQRTFATMLAGGDDACALEISSHALVLGRADATRIAAAAFTNLTQDHLDFHADMDDYFAAKRLLFTGSPDRRSPPGVSVVNLDDEDGRRLAAELESVETELVSFGTDPDGGADLLADRIDFDGSGSRFRLTDARTGAEHEVELPLPGRFNVSNALAALGLAEALGVELGAAVVAIAEADPVPGRMEPILEGQPFPVLVDYAHTSDSLVNVLAAARGLLDPAAGGRLICVFGCGGDRDRSKRPLMGAAASGGSDLSVLTSDNPRSEDPETILADVLEGVDPADRDSVLVEVDRRAAIALAFERARRGDLVVIAGKGHEQGQEFEAGRKLPFDDREVAREALREAGLSGDTGDSGAAAVS